jgi:lysophospholipase L1-like esterase
MNHVVLLGDSIFDNAVYVGDGADVISHLRAHLPGSWKATLLAIDGSTASEVVPQLTRLPVDATHIIVSAGGNDALQQTGVLDEDARSVAGVLLRFEAVAAGFERDYQLMLDAVLEKQRAAALCTIYYPAYDDPDMQRVSVAALAFFNDCIIRAAASNGLPLLDLRLVCNDRADYANEIEPSDVGGRKIAQGITRVLFEHDFSERRSTLFV